LANNLEIINCSLFDSEIDKRKYDIILAEGILNIVGFKKGFNRLNELLKDKGYIILHDEYKNHSQKIDFIKNKGYKILHSIILGHQIWWDNYYKYLA
jgi:hypothetical protein